MRIAPEFSFGAMRALPYLSFDLDYSSIDAPFTLVHPTVLLLRHELFAH